MTGTGRAHKRTAVSILVTRVLPELKSLGIAPALRRRATSLRKDGIAPGTSAQGSFYFFAASFSCPEPANEGDVQCFNSIGFEFVVQV